MAYFRSMKHFISILEENGVEKGKINGLSYGNGTFLFFADNNGIIIKHKLSFAGVSYIRESDLKDFLNNVYFPTIKNINQEEPKSEDIIL